MLDTDGEGALPSSPFFFGETRDDYHEKLAIN